MERKKKKEETCRQKGRRKKKEEGWEEKPSSVDHDAGLEESRQAVTLHANQISQLRELFVHWPSGSWEPEACPPQLKGGLTDQDTHPHAGSNRHPGSHQNIPASFQLCTFYCFSLFVLVSAWLQSLCLLFPGFPQCVLYPLPFLLVYFFFIEPQQKIYQLSDVQRGRARWLFKRNVSVGFRHGCLEEYALDTHTHTHASLTEKTETSTSQISQYCRGRGVSNNRFVCLLWPPKTWPPLHCRSFVEEDKRSAPVEIPQPCERDHVYDHHNVERGKPVQPISDDKRWKISSPVNMKETSRPIGKPSWIKPDK